MKRGDANIWWIIIGAIIALVVVIVLLVMFTGKSQLLERGLGECEGKGGICVSTPNCPSNTLSAGAFSCPTSAGETQKCCVGSPKVCTTPTDCGPETEWSCSGSPRSYCYEN